VTSVLMFCEMSSGWKPSHTLSKQQKAVLVDVLNKPNFTWTDIRQRGTSITATPDGAPVGVYVIFYRDSEGNDN